MCNTLPSFSVELHEIEEQEGYAWKIFDLSTHGFLGPAFEFGGYQSEDGIVVWDDSIGDDHHGFCLMKDKKQAIQALDTMRTHADNLTFVLKKVHYSKPVSLYTMPSDYGIFNNKTILLARKFKLVNSKFVRL